MHIPDQESRGHILPRRVYLLTGTALLVLTVVTVAASYVDWGELTGLGFGANVFVAMLIATLKASLVIMFFMHMKYEGGITWGFGLLYPLVLFAILLGFQVIDVFLRVIPTEPPVLIEQREQSLLEGPERPASLVTQKSPADAPVLAAIGENR